MQRDSRCRSLCESLLAEQHSFFRNRSPSQMLDAAAPGPVPGWRRLRAELRQYRLGVALRNLLSLLAYESCDGRLGSRLGRSRRRRHVAGVSRPDSPPNDRHVVGRVRRSSARVAVPPLTGGGPCRRGTAVGAARRDQGQRYHAHSHRQRLTAKPGPESALLLCGPLHGCGSSTQGSPLLSADSCALLQEHGCPRSAMPVTSSRPFPPDRSSHWL